MWGDTRLKRVKRRSPLNKLLERCTRVVLGAKRRRGMYVGKRKRTRKGGERLTVHKIDKSTYYE